jgi:hypothetical protein
VSDGRAERALLLGALDVDVNPLVIAGEPGECVDVLLGDLAPLAGPDRLPDQCLETFDSLYFLDRHGAHTSWAAGPTLLHFAWKGYRYGL